jgi:hypothetical protein
MICAKYHFGGHISSVARTRQLTGVSVSDTVSDTASSIRRRYVSTEYWHIRLKKVNIFNHRYSTDTAAMHLQVAQT